MTMASRVNILMGLGAVKDRDSVSVQRQWEKLSKLLSEEPKARFRGRRFILAFDLDPLQSTGQKADR